MEKTYNGKITINEFIKVFLEAEEILKTKIVNCKTFLQDYSSQRREAIQKLREIENNEKLNSFGIMSNSYLNIIVIEARNSANFYPVNFQPSIVLSFGNISKETKIDINHNNSLVWNEDFSL